MAKFSCTITIGDKPDWSKLAPEIVNNFLMPLREMVTNHCAGSLGWSILKSEETPLFVEYYLFRDRFKKTDHLVYKAFIKEDGRVEVHEEVNGISSPCVVRRVSLKEFLVGLAEFFRGQLEEKTNQYAEANAIGVIMEDMMKRLRSIKATAHYE